ncbi:MAG: ethanolamine utilization protein EutH [Acutalibacteraceae bacterium]|nr:ethanolamine utilization protein EutH [Acutalibacteraceae bacterium]
MNVLTIIIIFFFSLGALDKIMGDRFGLGPEFEKAFKLFSSMALSMLGMLVLAPAIGVWLEPFFGWFYNTLGIDPSIIPASLFANDMGGMTLAQAVCKNSEIGNFNAFVVSSMMGCVISFTIPFSIGVVQPYQHKELFIGLLCGIVTIPVGCFVSGFMCGLDFISNILNLLPLIILSVIIVIGLIFAQSVCIKVFSAFGFIMKVVLILGLVCAMFTFLTKITINEHFDTLENASFICVNACVTLSGALPFMFVVTKLLSKPLNKLGSLIGINADSAAGFMSTLVTNAPTFGIMDKMNKKGVVLNSAFAVSAAFAVGGHLAITMAFDGRYVLPMLVGKIVSGITSVALAMLIYKDKTEYNIDNT